MSLRWGVGAFLLVVIAASGAGAGGCSEADCATLGECAAPESSVDAGSSADGDSRRTYPEVPPPPAPTYGVLRSGVRMRALPSTSSVIFGTLPKGHIIDIKTIKIVGAETWVEIARGIWCCAKQPTGTWIDLK